MPATPHVVTRGRLFWPVVEGSAKFRFTLDCLDWDGRRVRLPAPLLFVAAHLGKIAAETQRRSGPPTITAPDRAIPADGQSIAYAASGKPGDTAMETVAAALHRRARRAGDPDEHTRGSTNADVVIPAMRHLAPGGAETTVTYAQPYLDLGFDRQERRPAGLPRADRRPRQIVVRQRHRHGRWVHPARPAGARPVARARRGRRHRRPGQQAAGRALQPDEVPGRRAAQAVRPLRAHRHPAGARPRRRAGVHHRAARRGRRAAGRPRGAPSAAVRAQRRPARGGRRRGGDHRAARPGRGGAGPAGRGQRPAADPGRRARRRGRGRCSRSTRRAAPGRRDRRGVRRTAGADRAGRRARRDRPRAAAAAAGQGRARAAGRRARAGPRRGRGRADHRDHHVVRQRDRPRGPERAGPLRLAARR